MIHPVSQTAKERAALSRLRQILNEPGLLRASWVKMKNTCGKSYCRCHRHLRHRHIAWYVGQSKNGKPRMECVPGHLRQEVQTWLKRYQEARELLEQVSDEQWQKLSRKQKV